MQMMKERIFLLLVVSIIFLLYMFFHLFNTPTESSISIEIYQQPISKTKSPRDQRKPIIFSKSQYLNQTRKPSENVIAYLVGSYSGDIRISYNPYPRLRERVLQLDERFEDSNSADVIIFHTGYPFRADILPIIEGSRRHVEFVNIDHIFYKFSPGFNPHIKDPSWSQRGKWNYHHMCYFWFKQVFEMEIMQKYRYMMRLDDDSQIQAKWPNIFDVMIKHQAVYVANYRTVDYDYVLPGITLVRNLTAAYIIEKNITARNPDMLADVFNHTIEVPNFWNNIELIDLSFLRRKEVLDFIRVIDESKGIFIHRWGDAPLRYITLALFANATQILHREKLGLAYCHPC